MPDLRTDPKPISRAWPFKRTFYGWAVVLAAFSASFGEVPAFGPILGIFMKPIEDELGWSRATIAAGFTIGSLFGALASMVVGRLVDRFGARFVVGIAGILISSSMLAISQIQEPWQFWAEAWCKTRDNTRRGPRSCGRWSGVRNLDCSGEVVLPQAGSHVGSERCRAKERAMGFAVAYLPCNGCMGLAHSIPDPGWHYLRVDCYSLVCLPSAST